MTMNKTYDYIIVGAGLYGATIAYSLCDAGKHCLVVDKRSHTGGNIHTDRIEGIDVHTYGAHIFHTSDEQVWQFVKQFVHFNSYVNTPIAIYKGKRYNMPFNMNTFHQLWGVTTAEEAQAKIAEQTAPYKDIEPANLEEQALKLVGPDIYQTLIKGYTEKQWGRECTELPAFIIRRLPVRMVYDNNYFNDAYQGIPIGGYNVLINKLLDGADCVTGVDYFTAKVSDVLPDFEDERLLKHAWREIADKMVFTGKVDQFYDYRFGQLQYRTVRFEQETLDTPNYQGNAVINYTEREVPYTRIIEHKHFESFGAEVYANPKTVISREYSTEWQAGMEPFYPVNDARNAEIVAQYKALAAEEKDVIFGGRLADYAYYDMAPVIQKVLQMEV